MKQPDATAVLKPRDSFSHGGGRHTQPPAGVGEASRFGGPDADVQRRETVHRSAFLGPRTAHFLQRCTPILPNAICKDTALRGFLARGPRPIELSRRTFSRE